MYFYSDTEPRQAFGGFKTPPDPNVMWLRHYANYVELSWMQASPLLSHMERRQVVKELGICERKMKYWYQKDEWSLERCKDEIERLKKLWQYSPPFPV